MVASRLESSVRMALLAGIVLLAACFPPPAYQPVAQPSPVVYQQPAPVATTTYTPQYYNGSVVYFDASGFPFYYLNGAATYVPSSCECYTGLVSYYRTYQVGYQQWYATEGTRLLSLGLNLGL